MLIMFDFGGLWSKIGGGKKAEGQTSPKSRVSILAVGTYLQRGSAPLGSESKRLALDSPSRMSRNVYSVNDQTCA